MLFTIIIILYDARVQCIAPSQRGGKTSCAGVLRVSANVLEQVEIRVRIVSECVFVYRSPPPSDHIITEVAISPCRASRSSSDAHARTSPPPPTVFRGNLCACNALASHNKHIRARVHRHHDPSAVVSMELRTSA